VLEALTFDFWGTLYEGAYGVGPRLALLDAALRRHGRRRDEETLRAAYDHAWSVADRAWRVEHRSLDVPGWLAEVLAFLRVDLPEQERAALRRPLEEVLLGHGEGPDLLPGVSEVVPRLARRYRLGLISDVGLTPGRVLRSLLHRDGLLPCFQALTFSDETGVTKPVPMVFHRTLRALSVRAEQAAHIGDLPETDLAGARAAGMRAVLFLGSSGREDGRASADACFEDYAELEQLLDCLGSLAR
jgi:putative hydrolase of the HAD superfamily